MKLVDFMGGAKDVTMSADLYLRARDKRVITVDPQSAGLFVHLPNPSNVNLGGPQFYIINVGATHSITVKDSGGTARGTIAPSESGIYGFSAQAGVAGFVVRRIASLGAH